MDLVTRLSALLRIVEEASSRVGRLYPDDLRTLLEELLGVIRKELLFCLEERLHMLARALLSPQQSSRRSSSPTIHHCTFLKGSSGLELTRACISQLCSSIKRCALQKSFPQSSHFPTMGCASLRHSLPSSETLAGHLGLAMLTVVMYRESEETRERRTVKSFGGEVLK